MAQPNWRNKERKDTKSFDAKGTPRSGGLWFAKGDSKSKKFLIENKTTDKENFTIQGKVWEKISKEAIIERRVALLSVEFGKNKTEVVVIDTNDFIELVENLDTAEKKLREIVENSGSV